MGNVALVPERDVLESDQTVRANNAGHATDAFRDDRITFVRHRTRALLTFSKLFLRFTHFGALPVTNVEGKLLERRRDHGERVEIFGISVSLDHLSRNRRGFQTKTRANSFFN